jgi:hypothetical protein
MGKRMETAEEMSGMMAFYQQIQKQGQEMALSVTQMEAENNWLRSLDEGVRIDGVLRRWENFTLGIGDFNSLI